MRAAWSLAVALILAARAASANPAEDAARRFVEARGFEARQAIDASGRKRRAKATAPLRARPSNGAHNAGSRSAAK